MGSSLWVLVGRYSYQQPSCVASLVFPIPAGAAGRQGAAGAATCKQRPLGHTRAEGLFSTVLRLSVY